MAFTCNTSHNLGRVGGKEDVYHRVTGDKDLVTGYGSHPNPQQHVCYS
jgi:hypothetical protein